MAKKFSMMDVVHSVRTLAALIALQQMSGKKHNYNSLSDALDIVGEIERAFLYREGFDNTGRDSFEVERLLHEWRAAEMLGLNRSRRPRCPSAKECEAFRKMAREPHD
jgi:hypothetical protein